jgi:hypothetical protein
MTNPTAKHVAVQEGMEARRDGKTFKDFEEAFAARIEAEKRRQGFSRSLWICWSSTRSAAVGLESIARGPTSRAASPFSLEILGAQTP